MIDLRSIAAVAYIFFSLLVGSVSIAVLIGNKTSGTGSCCLPASCDTSRLPEGSFRPDSSRGICIIKSEAAEAMGCAETANNAVEETCNVTDVGFCESFKSQSVVRTAGILGVCSPFSPIIGVALPSLVLFPPVKVEEQDMFLGA